METNLRTLYKTITWRIIATSTTMAVVYFLTGSIELMATAGLIDMVAKLVFYYIHERAWTMTKFGYTHAR